MMLTLESFSTEASLLSPVPLAAATIYQNKLPEMTAFVDEQLSNTPGIHQLIGGNPLQMMYDNHRHHGAFMATVFALGNYQLLAGTLPWVYRAYHCRQFSYDYFPLELRCWIAATEKFMAPEQRAAIGSVYEWMINRHENIIDLSQQELEAVLPVSSDWLERKNIFRVAALCGDHRDCLQMATDIVQNADDIGDFYLQVLQPVLYEIGILWEKNRISVAQEHLVSAIVTRVMATVNLVMQPPSRIRGKVVVAACANEYHEIGAMMISDVLELDGWNLSYLGANVPTADLLSHLQEVRPQVLALSITLAMNVVKVIEIIEMVRQDPALRSVKIVVGGLVFRENRELWHQIGADAFAADLAEARQLMSSFQDVA